MQEKLATELSDQLVFSAKKLNALVEGLRVSCSEEELRPYLEKISHIMALSFDLLDMVGEEYPHLNPYKKGEHH